MQRGPPVLSRHQMNQGLGPLSTPTLAFETQAFETQGQTQTLPAPGQVSLESSRCLDSSEPLGETDALRAEAGKPRQTGSASIRLASCPPGVRGH